MANTHIWKFVLNLPVCEMPASAEILAVAGQGQEVCVWAKVDPKAPTEARLLHVVPTGAQIPSGNLQFLGTALIHGGQFVYHVFEELPLQGGAV